MKILKPLFLAVLFAGVVVTHADPLLHSYAEGLPLPWPFPWAKECPMDWSEMNGRYLLADGANADQIDLAVTVVTDRGFKMVRVSRFSGDGHLIYDGFTMVNEQQKTIRLHLIPTNNKLPAQFAIIKLHYVSWESQCTADHLIPILTVGRIESESEEKIQYKMVKVRSPKN